MTGAGAIASLATLLRACVGAAGASAAMLGCAVAPAIAGGMTKGLSAAPNANTVETVTFADPRWPAVRVVRGAPRPPESAPVAAAAPAPLFRATAANTEIVTFGDGRGERVAVVRGGGIAPARPVQMASLPAGGRVETARFGGFGAPLVNIVRGGSVAAADAIELFNPASGGELDRVAFAVDGAESGHGRNLAMWRPDIEGPQGPMQVSAAAALDVGGGDRFDMLQNRLIGRAFLARMYQRYGNWPDAIAAYNWGPGNVDNWIAAGRPAERLPLETARYLLKVLRDSLMLGPS